MHNTAYILQKKYYYEAGGVLTLFTKKYGKINALIRKSKNKSSINLELFNKFNVVLRENDTANKPYLTDTPKSYNYEISFFVQEIIPQQTYHLKKDSLWLAFYMNELLCLLMPQNQPDSALFDAYQGSLAVLNETDSLIPEAELALRIFEMRLLDFMGILPDFSQDQQGNRICDASPQTCFYLSTDHGIVSNIDCLTNYETGMQSAYIPLPTSLLISLSQLDQLIYPQNNMHLQGLKKITRFLIHSLLQGRPLKSREMLKQLKAKQS